MSPTSNTMPLTMLFGARRGNFWVLLLYHVSLERASKSAVYALAATLCVPMQLKILLYNFFPVPLDTDSFWEAQHEGIDVERMHRRLHPSRQHLRYMSTQFQLDSDNKSSSYTPTTSPFVVEPILCSFFPPRKSGNPSIDAFIGP